MLIKTNTEVEQEQQKIKCTNKNLYIEEINSTKEEQWPTVFGSDKQNKQN